MKRLLITLMLLSCCWLTAMAEETEKSSIFWEDREIGQLENMTPELLAAVKRMHNRIPSVAISTTTIDENLSPKLRRVLVSRLYEILTTDVALKIGKCDECGQIRSELSGSFLKISRGIAEDAYRRSKARELNVAGFLDISVFMSERQLSVTFTAYDAQDGKIAFSEIITGDPGGRTEYTNIYLGRFNIPIAIDGTSIDHSAYILGMELSKRISESWLFAGNVALLTDNNSKLTTKYPDSISGLMIDGTAMYEMVQALGGRATIAAVLGMGQLLAPALTSPFYAKVGTKIAVGEKLTINLHYMSFIPALTTPETTGATYMALGWQW
ncbi:MAG: hypothetical protein HQM12_11830 [SAR324 cluster bacterium]|nr:hypothetical protein [SAR324 cluster bacterium]